MIVSEANRCIEQREAKFICEFPEGYDTEGVSIGLFRGMIIIAHPEHPPMLWDGDRWTYLEAA